MHQALLRRDRGYAGIFVVGVKTTGIFCRPTCFARKPRRENVEYFASASEALLAGYRPCRRCRPLDNGEQPPQWVESLRRRVDRAPTTRVSDADLRAMSIDPHRARRYFKRHYGMTFHAYHRARRMGMALREVRAGRDLTEVGFRHGYGSPSGFRRHRSARYAGASTARSCRAATRTSTRSPIRWAATSRGR